MPQTMHEPLEEYVAFIRGIYNIHLKQIILYGSYARGDFAADSDIDIMILLDLSDMEIKSYRHQLSDLTCDFNMAHDLDIKPIAKSQEHFRRWVGNYPFYANIRREGVMLYEAA